MSSTSIQLPYPLFTDLSGSPLDGGYIYIGTENLNPETNPIQVYWDAALTIPAAQPIRTQGGYPYRSGTPSSLYFGPGVNASITVKDHNGFLMFSGQIYQSNSSDIFFVQSGTGAVPITIQDRMRQVVSVKDFGAKGDNGTTDNYNPFRLAVVYLGSLPGGGVLIVPGGEFNKYVFKAQGGAYPTIYLPSNVSVIADDDVQYIVSAAGLANSGVHIYGTALFQNKDWATTGNRDIAIIGGSFKSANATIGATGNGGFIAFKNCLRPLVEKVRLLDTVGAARLQLSFCYGAKLLHGVVDYDTPHLTPWSFEDGLRVGSGCINTTIDDWHIRSGDDCIALNNEASECQDAFATPADARIPASSLTGANITGVEISNVHLSNGDGNAIRLYIGTGMTAGDISAVKISHAVGNTKSPGAGGTTVSMLNNSGTGGNTRIYGVDLTTSQFDCSNLTAIGSPGAIQCGGTDITVDDVTLSNVSTTYGIACGVRQKVVNCKITGAVNDGIYVGAADCMINNNYISGCGAAGVHIEGAAASHTMVRGNRITSTTGAAIKENGGADYTLATENDVSGAGAIDISAAGAHSIYTRNPGMTLGTVTLSPGASPYTYTTGWLYETVTVGGGTVSNIAINGVNTFATAGAFHVPPHTPVTVVYTVTPTMTSTLS